MVRKKSWRVRTRHVALFPGRRFVEGAPMSAVPERAKSVFLKAVEAASEEERRAYLDAACRDDDALRREVEGLLAHHGRLGAFLEPPAADPTGTGDVTPGGAPTGPRAGHPGAAEGIGAVVGPYRLVRAIGEGGEGRGGAAQGDRSGLEFVVGWTPQSNLDL